MYICTLPLEKLSGKQNLPLEHGLFIRFEFFFHIIQNSPFLTTSRDIQHLHIFLCKVNCYQNLSLSTVLKSIPHPWVFKLFIQILYFHLIIFIEASWDTWLTMLRSGLVRCKAYGMVKVLINKTCCKIINKMYMYDL